MLHNLKEWTINFFHLNHYMINLRLTFFIIALVFIGQVFRQNSLEDKMSEWRQLSVDSLESLEHEFVVAGNNDLLKSLLTVIEQQAEVKNDTSQLIWVYQRMAFYAESETSIKLLNKVALLAKSSGDIRREADATYLLGAYYYKVNQPSMAVEKFITAYEIAFSEKYHEVIVDALNTIASIKSEYGEDHEALGLQIESYQYLKSHANIIPNYYETFLISVDCKNHGWYKNRIPIWNLWPGICPYWISLFG